MYEEIPASPGIAITSKSKREQNRLPLWFILPLMLLLGMGTAHAQSGVRYVDSSVTVEGDGLSWATAFKTVALALDSVWQNPSIGELRVARGTYYPAASPYQMEPDMTGTPIYPPTCAACLTFSVRTGLEVYGGYPSGGGPRDVVANLTILGDTTGTGGFFLAQTVLIDSPDYWVTSQPDTTVLDGLTVAGSLAAIPTSDFYGAGINSKRGALKITHCAVTAGEYLAVSIRAPDRQTFITDCTTANKVLSAADLYRCHSEESLTGWCIYDCTAQGNITNPDPSAIIPTPMDAYAGPVEIRRCVAGNSMYAQAVGTSITSGGSLTIDSCIVKNVLAVGGSPYSKVSILNTRMMQNSSGIQVVGVQIVDGNIGTEDSIILRNVDIDSGSFGLHLRSNIAVLLDRVRSVDGVNPCSINAPQIDIDHSLFSGYHLSGALYLWGNARVANSVVHDNSVTGEGLGFGGGITLGGWDGDIGAAVSAAITNCTFYDNRSEAITAFENVQLSLHNCIFRNNLIAAGGSLVSFDVAAITGMSIDHCLLQRDSADYAGINVVQGPSNHYATTQPAFVDSTQPAGPDGIWLTADDGLRLATGSPGINAGSNAFVQSATDAVGAQRIQGSAVDAGAYEGGYAAPTGLPFLNTPTGQEMVTIVPNPASDYAVLKTTQSVQSVILLNALGQVVQQYEGGAGQALALDVSGLPPGAYFACVRLLGNGRAAVVSLVVAR